MNKNNILFDSLKIFKNDTDTALILFIDKSNNEYSICWAYGHAMTGPKGAPYEKLLTVPTLDQAEIILKSLTELTTAATILQLNENKSEEVKIKHDGDIYIEPTYN